MSDTNPRESPHFDGLDWSLPYQGQVLHEVGLGVARCRDLLYPPGLVVPAHVHDRPSITICLSGSVCEILPDERYDIGVSSVLVRPEGLMHSNRVGSVHLRALVIEVEGSRIDPFLRSDTLASASHFKSARATVLARTVAFEMRAASARRDLSMLGLFFEILAEVSRERQGRVTEFPDWLRNAMSYMRNHPTYPHSTEDLARRFDLHPAYFARVAKGALHCTVAMYSVRLRVEEGARQLAETDWPIARIARECHFSSQSQFTRSFTNLVGLSPSRYRRLLRDGSEMDLQ